MKSVLDRILSLQDADGSFPRKFKGSGEIVDRSGGSTPSATLPLVMAYSYFKDKRYLESARRTAGYLEHELIDKADYFSSTLDANCEDKEASLYASTAMHYLTYVTKGKEREHYMDLCRKSAYFCLSWYYMWDVPFAPGPMSVSARAGGAMCRLKTIILTCSSSSSQRCSTNCRHIITNRVSRDSLK